jgi:O-antigen/teichoic acid export membrane protein
VRLTREGEIDHARELARDALRLTLLLVPFTAVAAGASSGIVQLVFGAEFAPAGPILSRLLFAGVAVTVMAVGGTILIAGGRIDRQAWILVSLVPVAIGGHLWAIPRFGPIGAAWVSTCVMVTGVVLTLGAIARMWDIRPPAASLLRIALVSLAAGLGARAWPAAGWELIAELALFCLSIPLALVAMGEFSRRELSVARDAVFPGRATGR